MLYLGKQECINYINIVHINSDNNDDNNNENQPISVETPVSFSDYGLKNAEPMYGFADCNGGMA